jgi:hypothetical protein
LECLTKRAKRKLSYFLLDWIFGTREMSKQFLEAELTQNSYIWTSEESHVWKSSKEKLSNILKKCAIENITNL